MRLLVASLALGFAAGVTLFASDAAAYDRLATICPSDPLHCESAPITFSQVDTSPLEWSFDTGWVPSGSDVQVRVTAGVFADTHVDLAGALTGDFPTGLLLTTPGAANGGDFGFHYGAEFLAEGSVDISVLGVGYTWQGALPYIPKFNLQVDADQKFDAWGFDPGVTLTGTSMLQPLANIGLSDIIGGSIPGIDGGFALDVAAELDATYTTDRMVIAATDGTMVTDSPITSPTGEASYTFPSAPSVELDVHPEGTVVYTGVLHLEPAFYVTLLGSTWQIPILDIPIDIPLTSSDWVFDPQRVHVPLPWIVAPDTLELGMVKVGAESMTDLAIQDAGEADLQVTFVSSDPQFTPNDPMALVPAMQTFDTAILFAPTSNGQFNATVLLASNDPNTPMKTLKVHGTGYGAKSPATASSSSSSSSSGAGGGDETDDAPTPIETSGCACDAAGQARDPSSFASLLGAAAFAFVVARRRRR